MSHDTLPIPRYFTSPLSCVYLANQVPPAQDTDAFTARPDERALQAQVQDLVCYVWDNYLQMYRDVEDIFLMGVGNAYLGIKVLLINRGMFARVACWTTGLLTLDADIKSHVSGVVNFVDGNLRPVKSDVDQELSPWYKENSRVYVANDHACWADADLTRKVMKRRFGTVIRSEVNGLARMMTRYSGDVQRWMLDRVSEEEKQGDTTEEDRMAGS